MINKKGEEARPSGAIVLALIAAFVLIVVYLFLFGPFRSILENAGFLIPTLNASQPLAENIQLLRYDISEDEVKYYDGTKWHLFGADVVKLGDKKLSETTMLEDFTNGYYYNKGKREQDVVIESKVRIFDDEEDEKFSEAGKIPPLLYDALIFRTVRQPDVTPTDKDWTEFAANFIYPIFDPEELFERGDVEAFIISQAGYQKGDNKVYGNLAYGLDKKMRIRKINFDLEGPRLEVDPILPSEDLYRITAPLLEEWRDSVLKEPITINYNDDESNTYCVEKFDNKYLVVNLKEPKTEC
jgi:hypothetical protein